MNNQYDREEREDRPDNQIITDYLPPQDRSTRWMYDYDQMEWSIKAQLYGGWLTEDKKGYYVIRLPPNPEPFMNEKGIESTISILRGFVTKIQGLTIIDEERILVLCKDLHYQLAVFYFNHLDEFDCSRDKASLAIKLIMNSFEANWRKSMNGTGLKAASGSERIIEQINSAQPQKGLISKYLPTI